MSQSLLEVANKRMKKNTLLTDDLLTVIIIFLLSLFLYSIFYYVFKIKNAMPFLVVVGWRVSTLIELLVHVQ